MCPQDSITYSVIIANWNTRELLAQCLTSLQADLTQGSGQRGEVIVVDNASTDGSVQMVLDHFPHVRLMQNEHNAGFARANNQGIHAASGEYVLLLNSDTIVHAGAPARLVTFMDAHPCAGACGARLLNGDGSLQHACHPMLTPGREFWRLHFLDRVWSRASYAMATWSTRTPRQVEAIKGACLLLRRRALDQVGLLDEDYFMYTEEVDLCHRLGLSGWELWYVPEAVVTHFGGASSSQMAESMYVQLYRSKLQFYCKFGGKRRARLAKLLYLVAYAPRWLVAAAMARVRPEYVERARIYRHLLADLPGM